MTLNWAKQLVKELSECAEQGTEVPLTMNGTTVRVKHTVRGFSYWIDDVDYSLRQFTKALTLYKL